MSDTQMTGGYGLRPSLYLRWTLAIFIAIIALFPLWWMLNVVFSDPGIPVSVNPRLLPTSLSAGIAKIREVLTETDFMRAYAVSIIYTTSTIVLSLLVCAAAAYAFARFDFPGRRALFAVILFSLMVPETVTIIPTYLFVVDLGWINTFRGLVLPGVASAFGLFMLVQFMRSLPDELFEAARLDGAGHLRMFFMIAVPLSRNALTTLAIILFIKTWGNFMWPLIVATDPKMYTVGQIVSMFNSPYSYMTVDSVMTANLLAAVPPVVFFLLFQRKIIAGVATAGLK